MTRDADFSNDAKDRIAKRAGFRCSFPGCDRTTVGPGAEPHQFENTGEAAHIFSSSPDGPRGTGGLDANQRRRPQNGIWLCRTHAKLIDSHDGIRYPSFELQRWKATHEARIDHEHRGLPVPFGWLISIVMRQSPLFKHGTKLEFGKVTLLVGRNGIGKTAIAEWLAASCGDIAHVWRWLQRRKDRDPVDVLLNFAAPDPHVLQFEAGTDRKLRFCIDNATEATGIGHLFRVVYLAGERLDENAIDDVELIASACGVHRFRLIQAMSVLGKLPLPFVRSHSVRDNTENEADRNSDLQRQLYRLGVSHPQKVYMRFYGQPEERPFRSFSTQERSMALVSIGIALAYLESLHAPTLLIVDLGGHLLEDALLNAYASRLTESHFVFQTILITSRERPEINWSGWSIARLDGNPPSVTIEQEIV